MEIVGVVGLGTLLGPEGTGESPELQVTTTPTGVLLTGSDRLTGWIGDC